MAFFDGQNLFYSAREAFGYSHPNYDPVLLASRVCGASGWELSQVRFYTGVPDPRDRDPRSHFWEAKLAQLGRRGAFTFSRPCRNGKEKGIDVRIALDLVSCVREHRCDVAILFSQDQDLAEAVAEARKIAQQQGRWLRIASAYPMSPRSSNNRGINNSDWIRIERADYDACLDPRDYRAKPTR